MAGTHRDIIVAGAGIFGCLTGYLMAKQGPTLGYRSRTIAQVPGLPRGVK